MKRYLFLAVFLFLFSTTVFAQNTAAVSQSGPDELVDAAQTGTNHILAIDQNGDTNQAVTSQTGFMQVADVDQLGMMNETIIQQAGEENTANMWSKGSYNKTNQSQSGRLHTAEIIIYGDANEAIQSQFGSNNSAEVRIGTEIVPVSGNKLETLQDGSGNFISLDQVTGNNVALFSQYGEGNYITSEQRGGEYNRIELVQRDNSYARILQEGDHNSVTGPGGAGAGEQLNGASLTIEQLGTNNQLQLYQNSGFASVYQLGEGNVSIVNQY